MLPRTVIIARHICQKAAKTTHCDSSYCKIQVGKYKKIYGTISNTLFITLHCVVGLIPRHLCLIEGSAAQFSQCAALQPPVRAVQFRNYSSKDKQTINVTSKELKTKETTGISSSTKVTSIQTESNKASKTESLVMSAEAKPDSSGKEKAKKGTPILKVIATNLKEGSVKASDIKVNLENVKEQSLEKPIPITEAPIQQLKEKIMELKTKEAEAGMCFIFG